MAKEKQSLMNRFIHIIEKGGNKLPHPFIPVSYTHLTLPTT